MHRKAARDEDLWKHLCRSKFAVPDDVEPSSWRELYRCEGEVLLGGAASWLAQPHRRCSIVALVAPAAAGPASTHKQNNTPWLAPCTDGTMSSSTRSSCPTPQTASCRRASTGWAAAQPSTSLFWRDVTVLPHSFRLQRVSEPTQPQLLHHS